MIGGLRVTEANGRVRFSVRVQPRASSNEIAGAHGDALRVRLTAPPVEGAANEALIEFLARAFAVPRTAVRLVGGTTSRTKLVEVDGRTSQDVLDLATPPV